MPFFFPLLPCSLHAHPRQRHPRATTATTPTPHSRTCKGRPRATHDTLTQTHTLIPAPRLATREYPAAATPSLRYTTAPPTLQRHVPRRQPCLPHTSEPPRTHTPATRPVPSTRTSENDSPLLSSTAPHERTTQRPGPPTAQQTPPRPQQAARAMLPKMLPGHTCIRAHALPVQEP